MDHILDSILSRLGNLESAFLLDDYAAGRETGIIDLGLLCDIDRTSLQDMVGKAERYLERKIRTLILTRDEYNQMREQLEQRPNMAIWVYNGDIEK